MKRTKCHDRDYFCDTLDEIMLVREAVEFNSSMESNNVNFTWPSWFRGLMQNSTNLQNVFVPESATTLTPICACLDAVVNDC